MRVSLAGLTISLGLIFAAAVFWPDPNQAPLPVLNQAVAQKQGDEPAPPPAPMPEPSADERLRAALDQKIPAEIVQTPLREVLEYLEQIADIQIYADWRRLEELQVTSDSPITLNLHNVSVGMTLDLALGQLADGIATNQREGVLIITTADALADQMETRVYHVSNLLDGQDPQALLKLRQLVASIIAPGTWNTPRVIYYSGGGMGAMGGMMPGAGAPGGAPVSAPARKLGSVETYRGNLVVRHTPAVQAQVRGLLDQLAEAKLEASAPPPGGRGSGGAGMY